MYNNRQFNPELVWYGHHNCTNTLNDWGYRSSNGGSYLNDEFSSFIGYSDCLLKFYCDEGYQGPSTAYVGQNPRVGDFFNDEATSIIIS